MLAVHENKRCLTKNSRPFFYMADTAWELFHRLTLSEATYYYSQRVAQGFTVIQSALLAELDGMGTPNAQGDLPFTPPALLPLNEAYFAHCDALVEEANRQGLVMGILPSWGSYWKDGAFLHKENAFTYGKLLGQRYKERDVIWILGGDRCPDSEDEYATVRQLAMGIKDGCSNTQLITFHPMGPGRSATYFHGDAWLDFNMHQSSHAVRNHPNYLFTQKDYALSPVKPTLDGEPRYEHLPVGFYNKTTSAFDRFDDFDTRQAAYTSVFSGACGHTYGNGNVWQMWTESRTPALHANVPWQEALHHPGARQMGILRKLMETLHFESLIPAPELILDGPKVSGEQIHALRTGDGSIFAFYSPYGRQFTIDNSDREGRFRELWMNPRYDTYQTFLESDLKAIQTYAPPGCGRGQDWVLCMIKA